MRYFLIYYIYGLDLQQHLPLSCLSTEGDEYIFTAKMKLLDSEGNPFACDKVAGWGTALKCPQVTIQVDHPTLGVKRYQSYDQNTDPWKADEWNNFESVVTVNDVMMQGEDVFFYVQGPASGVSIVFDDVALTHA